MKIHIRSIKDKNSLYYNGKIYSKSGELLCFLSEKRIRWYLKRNLATIISEEPLCIKLKFDPPKLKSRKQKNLLIELENRCVVCGRNDSLSKHHVVPRCYRKSFPEEIKSNFSHDVLMLCTYCHGFYEVEADLLKTQINTEILKVVKLPKVSEDETKELSKNMKRALALLNYAEKMPLDRKNKLEEVLKPLIPIIDEKNLTKFIEESKNKINTTRIVFTKKANEFLINYFNSINLDEFMFRWRKHFVDTMSPKYLPKGWVVDLKVCNNLSSE